FGRQRDRRLVHLAAFFDADFAIVTDLVVLFLRVDGADVGVFVERIADDQGFDAFFQLAHHFTRDTFLDEETGARAANMALIEVDRVDSPLHRLVDGRVLENDVGGFAAKFKRVAFGRAGKRLHNVFANGGR